jgi:hypothetical protein
VDLFRAKIVADGTMDEKLLGLLNFYVQRLYSPLSLGKILRVHIVAELLA